MTISVTTRSVKGSALTFTEMDDNFNDLAVNATKTVQGNIEVADQTETDALSSETLAVSPSTLIGPVNTIVAGLSLTLDDLFTGTGTGTFTILARAAYDIIEVEWVTAAGPYDTLQIVEASIVNGRDYLCRGSFASSGGTTFSRFDFTTATSMTLTTITDDTASISRVTGIKFN